MAFNPLFQHSPTIVIQELIQYANNHGDLLHKFDNDFYLSLFDRHTIEDLQDSVDSKRKLD